MVYKVVIIGAGGHATSMWRSNINIHDDFEAVGIVDTNPAALEQMPAAWGIDEDNIAETVDQAVNLGIVKKGDIALISTPINTHAIISAEAMEHGLHVLCEKNMAESMSAGNLMVKSALEHPELATVVGHQYPYWLQWPWQLRREIKLGRIGEIDNVVLKFLGGGNGWQPAPRGSQNRKGWRRFLSHPFLEDWIIHYIDMLRYLTGMDAVSVNADLWKPKWSLSYGTQALNLQMLFAEDKDYEDPANTLQACDKTTKLKRRWQNGRIPEEWAHVNFHSNGSRMGPVQCGVNILIQGTLGSIELCHDNYEGDGVKRPNNVRITSYDPATYDHNAKYEDNWKIENINAFRRDVECWPEGELKGPGPRWMGDNNEEEWGSQAFMLEEVKQFIESDGKIKPLRSFENCIKTFAISMGAMESTAAGGKAVWLPDLWEV
jgi:predicted dehydrogenase